MKIKSIPKLLFLLFGSAQVANAQWVPPVNFPSPTNVCDNEPWKLVLYDNFDGNSLNTSKWNTYISWDGMSRNIGGFTVYGDHSDWQGARECNANALFKDQNVVVSNGTCKLLLRNEPYTWQCPSCATPETKNLTTAVIATPFHLVPNGAKNYFNSARIEARIKFPTFSGAWCAFWLWNGAGVNEIDMAEAWGGSAGWPYFGSRPHDTYNLHAWAPNPNTYGVPNNVSISNTYPKQSWTDWFLGRNLHQDDWHTYTCEWDTASIKTYLDGNLVNTIWKYYQNRLGIYYTYRNGSWYPTYYTYQVGSECNTISGNWNITYGYPYNSKSESQLRLSTGFTDEQTGDPNSNYTKGQMEVDYVKVWQKHPADDGHTDLCNFPIPVITGPNIVCNSSTFTVNPIVGGSPGAWSVSNGLTIGVVGGTSNSSMMTAAPANSIADQAVIQYSYTPGACDQQTVTKIVDVGPPKSAIVSCVSTSTAWSRSFNLSAQRPGLLSANTSPTTYQWTIQYGPYDNCSNLQTYTTYGQYVSTPSFATFGSYDYCVKWTLKITNACGSYYTQGQKTSGGWQLQPIYYEIGRAGDTSAAYFHAIITDSAKYETDVANRIGQTMISEEDSRDSIAVKTMIEHIRYEALEPYLVLEPVKSGARKITPAATLPASATKLYPNPANDILNIEPDKSLFADNAPVHVYVYDLLGKIVKSATFDYSPGGSLKMSMEGLTDGNYILLLDQNMKVEHFKFEKRSGK
ncbi:family 16 glycosylhydrolase [Chitinophagaceae bacterium MMS25-I14]